MRLIITLVYNEDVYIQSIDQSHNMLQLTIYYWLNRIEEPALAEVLPDEQSPDCFQKHSAGR